MDDVESSNYDRAIKSLDRIEGKAAGSILAQQAQLELAYLYWKTADKVQALATIDRFIKLHPSSPALDYALYLRGVINFNDDLGFLSSFTGQNLAERDQAAARESYQSFKQLSEQFPDSKYTADARLRMDFTVKHAGRVRNARRRLLHAPHGLRGRREPRQGIGARVPADRVDARGAVHHGRRLRQAGLTLLRDDAQRVLDKNFPNSTLASTNRRRPGTSSGDMTAPRSLALPAPKGPAASGPAEPDPPLP